MEVIFLIGRIMFVAVFIASGIAHFQNREAMTQYAESKGAPGGEQGVLLSGAAIILGGLLILLGLWPDVGALLIFAFLLPTAYYMHDFWNITDPQEQQGQQAQFMKNVSMAGGALIILYLYWVGGEFVDLSLTGPLFVK